MRSALLTSLVLASLVLAGCGGSDNDGGLRVRDSVYAVSGMTPIVVADGVALYLANEAASGDTDLNGDGDTDDDVAVQLLFGRRTETVLGVACRSAAAVGSQIYLVVDEAEDGTEWGGAPGMDEVVLLHYSEDTQTVAFVDVLDPRSETILALELLPGLVYASADTTPVADGTSLRFLDPRTPTTPEPLPNEAGGGFVRPLILGAELDLVFLAVDENDQMVDRNGDMDATDEAVLAVIALLDEDTAVVQNAGAALADLDAPVRAERDGDDWLVACLVNEAAQGDTNLNDPAPFASPTVPASCAADDDTEDDVLHYFVYSELDAAAPDFLVNTGLAGRDRIEVTPVAVATLSDEAAADCDMNEDGDMADTMVRWVLAVDPIAPPSDPAQLVAVATDVPGGAMGFTELSERFVCIVDEEQDSRDHDGKVQDHDLVAWIDPLGDPAATWTFAHQDSGNETHGTGVFDRNGGSEPYAGASWMAAESEFGRLGIAYQEEVPGTNPLITSLNNNYDCDVLDKDDDLIDSLPVWADFESGPTLDFDGTGFAVLPDNAGIRVAFGLAFFRVDEMRDSFDYNDDGDMADLVLLYNPVSSCGPEYVADSSAVDGPVVETDGLRGGVFLTSETYSGEDINGDGDADDLVPRYFSF